MSGTLLAGCVQCARPQLLRYKGDEIVRLQGEPPSIIVMCTLQNVRYHRNSMKPSPRDWRVSAVSAPQDNSTRHSSVLTSPLYTSGMLQRMQQQCLHWASSEGAVQASAKPNAGKAHETEKKTQAPLTLVITVRRPPSQRVLWTSSHLCNKVNDEAETGCEGLPRV